MAVGTAPDTVDPQVVRLVERARQGEADAFAELYDRYLDRVYGYIRRRVGSTHVAEELTQQVRAALGELSPDHREVLELRFVNDLSVSETAAVLDRTVGATKALQYRALQALAEALRDRPGMAGLLASGRGSVFMALGLLKRGHART